MQRRPLVVHEQNAVAGMTNRWLTRFAETVLEAFPGSFGDKVITRCTGNPVRKDVAELSEPAERFAGRTGPVRILVVQCGEKNLEAAQQSYDAAGVKASVEPFIADMAEAYAWADLVVCRAGALTVSELCAAGVGAILVPFPHAVDDHQTRNGQHMVKAGAAILVPQPRFTPEALADTLKGLSGDREKILGMAQAARSLARPDATERVVNYCLEAANG